MVGQRSPSLYELLEVSSGATFEEIEQAYHRIASYLGGESLAVYSILDGDDARSARTQIDEAFRTLSDPDRRAAYDRARREDASYPPMMVPVNTGDSTSTAGGVVDDPPLRSRGQDERDKRLPIHGRTQPRAPLRGPGARTGRTPRYGRNVGTSAEPTADDRSPTTDHRSPTTDDRRPTSDNRLATTDNRQPTTEIEPKRKPRYGRAQPVGPTPAAAPPQPAPRAGVRDEAFDTRASEMDDDDHVEASLEPAAPPYVPEPEPAPPAAVESKRPELVKTVSEVLEPRQRPTVPPPAQLSASARSKRRVLSPSVVHELSGDVEFGGALLRRLRESTGASLDEVAEITKVSKRYLIAMETNDFAALPAAVYTRGFVAEYARVLGLDVTRVTKSFMALYAKYRGVGG